MNYIQTNAPNGLFTFNADGSSRLPVEESTPAAATPWPAFMMGQMTQDCGGNNCGSTYEIQFRPATTNYQYGFFAQDNWKVTSQTDFESGLAL